MNHSPLLEVASVDYKYGKKEVLKEVTFELEKGKVLSLLGPNGSGKSTLLKLVSGLLSNERGQMGGVVRWNGKNFFKYNSYERAARVAYVPSDLSVEFPVSVYETVSLGSIADQGGFFPEKVEWALDLCKCRHLSKRQLRSLSGGERQLVILARALVQGAKILFLDEALSKMDLHHQAYIGRLLSQLCSEDYSFVIVSHDINMVTEWADESLLLKEGSVVARGETAKVLSLDNIKKLYPSNDFFIGENPLTKKPKVFFNPQAN